MEALYWHNTSNGVQCDLCPHTCKLSDTQTGLCHNRINYGNILYATSYGHLCAVCDDPIEKKPLFHFLPGSRCLSIASTGCNFTCHNCQNWEISQAAYLSINHINMQPKEVVKKCVNINCPTIGYTYTEPLVAYEFVRDTACLAREAGIKNIIVSNGYINEEPIRRLSNLIDAANIDLKFFSDKQYSRVTNGSLQPVLRTLEILRDAGVWLEITNLLIPTYNDAPDTIRSMCQWLVANGFAETPLHFSRFIPIYRMNNIPPTPLKSLLLARDIAINAGMKYIYIGNISEIEGESTYCPNCNKLLIHRHGFTVGCNNITGGKCPECGEPIPGVWN